MGWTVFTSGKFAIASPGFPSRCRRRASCGPLDQPDTRDVRAILDRNAKTEPRVWADTAGGSETAVTMAWLPTTLSSSHQVGMRTSEMAAAAVTQRA